jgi:competence protein ComEC
LSSRNSKSGFVASAILGAAVLFGCLSSLQSQPVAGKLHIYFIDVEGGQATLFVTPAGQSLLVDTGWPDNKGRDADRIVAAAKKAGLSKIDYVLITHYHEDHAGGIPQLVDRIPVGTFLDHGPNRELDKGITEKDYAEYQAVLAKGKSKVIHETPGNVLPIKGMTATVISEDGNLIAKPLAGAGAPNAYCKDAGAVQADETENARSLGIAIQFGKLKLLDLGDLTKDKEKQLVCPVNKLGKVDIYIVSHHGWSQSSSPVFVDALHARVAIMDNGEMKGGSTPVLQTIRKAPGLETLWQVHYSKEGGDANNTSAEYIANLLGQDGGKGLELVADPNGSFDITNSRTGVTQHYPAK